MAAGHATLTRTNHDARITHIRRFYAIIRLLAEEAEVEAPVSESLFFSSWRAR